jgi:hypothetical protein
LFENAVELFGPLLERLPTITLARLGALLSAAPASKEPRLLPRLMPAPGGDRFEVALPRSLGDVLFRRHPAMSLVRAAGAAGFLFSEPGAPDIKLLDVDVATVGSEPVPSPFAEAADWLETLIAAQLRIKPLRSGLQRGGGLVADTFAATADSRIVARFFSYHPADRVASHAWDVAVWICRVDEQWVLARLTWLGGDQPLTPQLARLMEQLCGRLDREISGDDALLKARHTAAKQGGGLSTAMRNLVSEIRASEQQPGSRES